MKSEPIKTQWPMHQCILLLIVLGYVSDILASEDDGMYLNQFAIRVNDGKRETAEEIAREHGFEVARELRNINVFLLEHREVEHRSKRSAVNHLERLQRDKRVAHAQQELGLVREKRHIIHDKQNEFLIKRITDNSVYERVETANIAQRDNINPTPEIMYNDPYFKDMWYLINDGQSGGEVGLDMNVAVVWQSGFTGKGVVVTILDDGLDHTHPDLKDNYDPEASDDLNNKNDTKNDPMPDMNNPHKNSHGTRCAGEVAAKANNGVCGVGIAHEASIGGIRVLDGRITDSLEAEALNFNMNYIHMYSASWGPVDDGAHMEGPHHYTHEALIRGTKEGRNGLGSIFVWANGNGGMHGDDCGADGYTSLPETLSVGSINDWGRSPFFTENCSSTLAVVPSGGSEFIGQFRNQKPKLKVITSDVNGGCIENFQGTSAAAPLAAGCLATVLQANPLLTWRDLQHLVVRTSRIPSADDSWTINGAGYHVSPRFGFGLMDCGKMVELAQNWQNVPERRLCNTTKTNYQFLKRGDKIVDKIEVDGCHGNHSIDRVEHVQVYLKMSTDIRGETEILLISPANTSSRLLSPRLYDNATGEWEFTFTTVHSWDESPRGTWTLMIINHPRHAKTENKDGTKLFKIEDPSDTVGYIKEWSLGLWGSHGARHNRAHLGVKRTQQASYPSAEQILRIKRDEMAISKRTKVKRAQNADLDKRKTFVKKSSEEEKLVRRLYDLLHGNGARTVRKRVLNTDSASEVMKRNKVDNLEEMNEMVDDIAAKLKRMLSERKN